MKKTILNLTPHPVTILGEVERIFQSDGIVRLKAETVSVGTIDGVPITKTVFSEPEGLPEEKENIYLIVSQLVKNALPGRNDLLVPTEIVRDNEGKIIGCKSLGL